MTQPEKSPFFRPVQQGLILLALTAAIFGLAAALYSARWILLVMSIGIGLGTLVTPLTGIMQRKLRIPQGLSVAILYVVWIAALATGLYLLINLVAEHGVPLLRRMPELAQAAEDRIESYLAPYPWALRQLRALDLRGGIGSLSEKFLQGIQLGATAIGGFFFTIAVALYFSVSPKDFLAGFLSLFPAHMRPKVKGVAKECASSLRRWFGAQLIAMSAVGTLTAIGLWAVGMDFWLPFGLLTAALDIVPYLGPILAAASAAVATLGQDPGKVPLVIGVYIVMQKIEGDIVIPLVMRGRVKLPPIQLMTTMLILGSWFGILGVIVAPPLVTVARTLYLMLYVSRMDGRTAPPKAEAAPPSVSRPAQADRGR